MVKAQNSETRYESFEEPKNDVQNVKADLMKEEEFSIYKEVSDAGPEVEKLFSKFLQDLGPLPKDIFEAGKAIRTFLIKNNYQYDDRFFKLQDILKHKKGNCLGLTLLMGAVLREKGFEPKYEIIINPKDAIYKLEIDVFKEYSQGDYFDYDHPKLPHKAAEVPQCRFTPLGHPRLILGDQYFESTNLNETEEEPPLGEKTSKRQILMK